LDVGFGGDPISQTAIRMDMPAPYAYTGDFPVQLGGDCRNLKWIANDSLDYLYSSHVLEDFDRTDTESVLREWIRVVKPGGLVVLLLPDQVRYIASCLRRGEIGRDGRIGNPHHSIDDFSIDYVMQVAVRIGGVEKHHCLKQLGEYSFLLVLKKTKPTSAAGDKIATLTETLDQLYQERSAIKQELKEAQGRLQYYEHRPLLKMVLNRLKRRLGISSKKRK
jgi:ubiquinone/menaquinone biosynthesis C-methylase UbiE